MYASVCKFRNNCRTSSSDTKVKFETKAIELNDEVRKTEDQ